MGAGMKGVWVMLTAVFLLCGLTACGGGSGETAAEDGKVRIRAYLGGGDLSEKIDAMVEDFNAQSDSTIVEVVPMPADTASMITVMFNSGNTPVVMALETGDLLRARDRLVDLSDLEAVQYASKGTIEAAEDGEAVYGLPYRIEGMGLIYNRAVLDEVLGKDFEPDRIRTQEDLRAVFEEIQAAGIAPVVLGTQDWSLSTHLTTDIYTGQSESPREQAEFIETLKSGEGNLAENRMFNQVMDTLDILREYNYFKENPLLYANDGDTTKQARVITSGDAAFWFQGNWGSTALEALDPEGEYGIAKSILDYQRAGKTKVAYMANTADHYVDTGAALQRYMDGQIGREEVAQAYEAYWRAK